MQNPPCRSIRRHDPRTLASRGGGVHGPRVRRAAQANPDLSAPTGPGRRFWTDPQQPSYRVNRGGRAILRYAAGRAYWCWCRTWPSRSIRASWRAISRRLCPMAELRGSRSPIPKAGPWPRANCGLFPGLGRIDGVNLGLTGPVSRPRWTQLRRAGLGTGIVVSCGRNGFVKAAISGDPAATISAATRAGPCRQPCRGLWPCRKSPNITSPEKAKRLTAARRQGLLEGIRATLACRCGTICIIRRRIFSLDLGPVARRNRILGDWRTAHGACSAPPTLVGPSADRGGLTAGMAVELPGGYSRSSCSPDIDMSDYLRAGADQNDPTGPAPLGAAVAAAALRRRWNPVAPPPKTPRRRV